jgi:hypothetical protein
MVNDDCEYMNPFTCGYEAYFNCLIEFNKNIHDMCSKHIGKEMKGFSKDWSIMTTGSDARLEKGPVSPVELVLYTYGNQNDDVKEKLKDSVSSNSFVSFYDRCMEIKDVSNNVISESVFNSGLSNELKICSPNRFLDASFIFGDILYYELAKQSFLREIRSDYGKSILKKIKHRGREHLVATKTGIQKYNKNISLLHFDVDKATSFYDPEARLWSFKQGPLRAVQYAIVKDSLKFIRSENDADFIFDAPRNTVQKLEFLMDENILSLSKGGLSDLLDNYKYFLWLYHKSQWMFNKGVDVVSFDSREVRDRCKNIEEICSGSLF